MDAIRRRIATAYSRGGWVRVAALVLVTLVHWLGAAPILLMMAPGSVAQFALLAAWLVAVAVGAAWIVIGPRD